jgi:P2-related tail formation protein
MASTYKVLGQANPSATTLTDVYTVPGATAAIVSTIVVCNRSAVPTTFRLGIAVAGAGTDPKQYLAYDAPIDSYEVVPFTIGATLAATDVVRIYAVLATVSVNVFGEELT